VRFRDMASNQRITGLTFLAETGLESRKKEAAFVTKNRQMRVLVDSEVAGIGEWWGASSRLTPARFTLLALARTRISRTYIWRVPHGQRFCVYRCGTL
jgi:hypothetical protein